MTVQHTKTFPVKQHFSQYGHKASNKVLNEEMSQRLLQRLQLINLQPNYIIDLGCGNGHLTHSLKQSFTNSTVMGIDFSETTLRASRPKRSLWRKPAYESVCANAYHLPIASESCQLVTANLLMPFCFDLPTLLHEIQRVLTVGGVFIFNSLGPDSLAPLKQFWPQQACQNLLVDMHDIGDQLVKAQLSDPVMDVQYLTIEYANTLQAAKEMYWLGASPQFLENTPSNWVSNYRQMRQAYPQGVDIQLELINGHAFKPQQTRDHQTGEVNISLDGLRSRL